MGDLEGERGGERMVGNRLSKGRDDGGRKDNEVSLVGDICGGREREIVREWLVITAVWMRG